MANIIYSQSSGFANAAIGKMETHIRMILEHESDLLTKAGGTRDWLFNVEKSKHFAETIVAQNEFDTFVATPEGGGAENDTISETYKKIIQHVEFMKEFHITTKLMEDANYGVAADAKGRAENFIRAYYKTMNKLCEYALANATNASGTFSGTDIDMTSYDNLPLFHKSHKWGGGAKKTGTQPNYFYDTDGIADASAAEDILSELAVKMRNVKDENGEAMGYTADTIILPGNLPRVERSIKKACGTEQASGGSSANYINTQFGNWTLIVLPTWQASTDTFMLMSSEANRNLKGNMFFDRTPLTVRNWEDNHTGNYVCTGRCRFGVGFGTYKHIMLYQKGAATNAVSL